MKKIIPTVCMLALSVASSLAAAQRAPAAKVSTQEVKLEIAAQPVEYALAAFAEQSGTQIVFYTDLAVGLRAPRLSGSFTPQAALNRLLEGSGLEYEFVNDGRTVTIRSAKGSLPKPSAEAAQREELRMAQADVAQPPNSADASGSGSKRDATAAAPDSADTKVQEIVVTAQKRVERLQDVPVPVTVVSSETLVSTNQLRLADYYTRIPGLNLAAAAGVNGSPGLAIRGLSAGVQNNTASTVGMVVDEVQYSGSGQGLGFLIFEVDPTDVARIEVLRGPQGTLYGANSLGGLLKYVTVDPSLDRVGGVLRAGGVNIRNGDEMGYSLSGAVNLPVGDSFAVRASGFTRRDPGFIDDPRHDREGVNWGETTGGRLVALWTPSENLSLKVGALFQDAKSGSNQVTLIPGGEDFRQDDVPGSKRNHRKIQVYTANLSAKVGRVDLTAISAYAEVESAYLQDVNPGGAAAGSGAVGNRLYGQTGVLSEQTVFSDKFSQEVRLAIPLGEKVEWLLGGYYARDHKDVPAHITVRDYATGGEAGWYADFNVGSSFKEYSAFANLTFRLTEKFDVQVGGRQGRYKATFSSASFGPALAAPAFVPELNVDDDAFTYLVTPRFRISPDLMVYARAASGYRTGGANTGLAVVSQPKYGPDSTQNYEMGIKGRLLGGVLSFDASVYHIDWNDIQVTIRDPGNTFSYAANAGRAKSDGVELSLESQPLSGLTISAWVAYNDAQLTENFPPSAQGAFARDGERLPLGSRWSGNFSVDQAFPLTAAVTAVVGGSASYVGDRLGDFRTSATAPRFAFPSYTKLDLRAGVKYESWEIDLFANNVTDKRALLGGYLVTSPIYTIIEPRTIGVSASKRF